MDSETKFFLDSVKVGSLTKAQNLVYISSTDSISHAMQILSTSSITGAPVFDPISSSFVGFIDVLDLSMFVVKMFSEHYNKHPHLYDPKELEKRFALHVSEVVNASRRDPFIPISTEENLSFLINNFLKNGIHRVPIKGENNQIAGIVSQSDVIRYLQQHAHHIHVQRERTLGELGLDRGNVISISHEEPLIKAFSTILAHNITGLAVVSAQTGELLNNLSASDLKGITQTSFFKLESPIHQVFSYLPKEKLRPVTSPPNSTLGELMNLFEKTGVHRIFVVDPQNKPINVVTLTDVLNVFVTPFTLS